MRAPLLCLVGLVLVLSVSRGEPGNEVVLNISSTPENPRNSEGAFVALRSGRILFYYSQFYGGSSDFSPARIAEIHSDDQGLTWSAPHAFAEKSGGVNLMSVSVLRLASGKLAMFYVVKRSGIDCHPYMRISTDEAKTWSEPKPVIAAPGYFVLNNDRVIQTRSGRLIVPVAFNRSLVAQADDTTAVPHARFNDYRGIILWYLSDDEGSTWREAKTFWTMPIPSESGLQEPGAVELADGSLYAWARSDHGQFSFRSTDDGDSWSAPEPTELKSPASPAGIKRLPDSAGLLCIFNDHSGRFPYPASSSTYRGRTPLVAAISDDGARTWPGRKVLEDDPQGQFAYTAIHFVGDHVLLGYSAAQTGGPHLGALRLRRIALSRLPTGAVAGLPSLEQTPGFPAGRDGVVKYRIPAPAVTNRGTLPAFCDARANRPGDPPRHTSAAFQPVIYFFTLFGL